MSADTGPRRQSSRVSKRLELYEPPSKKACHVHAMLTAMAASVAAGDSISLLATMELKKGSLVSTMVHLDCEDYEPSHRKYMLLCKDKVKWETGEREELNSIEEKEVWMKTPVPTGTKVIPLKWYINSREIGWVM